ncbi:ATP-binding cassette sub-family B member 5 [Besnoitia besnoiti]|uniref:ATP-binding cassette sub-family B member 5 n=1 Tax=Besnoitia besnoiti TaxID=94643 RepID=A0A2A9MJF1_BESBE|nr:ATP-binding cassette sub-family B member 5 [Besnoitia besnoiti]PFH38039.1 ATP-binding cassette sub-family B member 5 [Besnoitia besnoiti]
MALETGSLPTGKPNRQRAARAEDEKSERNNGRRFSYEEGRRHVSALPKGSSPNRPTPLLFHRSLHAGVLFVFFSLFGLFVFSCAASPRGSPATSFYYRGRDSTPSKRSQGPSLPAWDRKKFSSSIKKAVKLASVTYPLEWFSSLSFPPVALSPPSCCASPCSSDLRASSPNLSSFMPFPLSCFTRFAAASRQPPRLPGASRSSPLSFLLTPFLAPIWRNPRVSRLSLFPCRLHAESKLKGRSGRREAPSLFADTSHSTRAARWRGARAFSASSLSALPASFPPFPAAHHAPRPSEVCWASSSFHLSEPSCLHFLSLRSSAPFCRLSSLSSSLALPLRRFSRLPGFSPSRCPFSARRFSRLFSSPPHPPAAGASSPDSAPSPAASSGSASSSLSSSSSPSLPPSSSLSSSPQRLPVCPEFALRRAAASLSGCWGKLRRVDWAREPDSQLQKSAAFADLARRGDGPGGGENISRERCEPDETLCASPPEPTEGGDGSHTEDDQPEVAEEKHQEKTVHRRPSCRGAGVSVKRLLKELRATVDPWVVVSSILLSVLVTCASFRRSFLTGRLYDRAASSLAAVASSVAPSASSRDLFLSFSPEENEEAEDEATQADEDTSGLVSRKLLRLLVPSFASLRASPASPSSSPTVSAQPSSLDPASASASSSCASPVCSPVEAARGERLGLGERARQFLAFGDVPSQLKRMKHRLRPASDASGDSRLRADLEASRQRQRRAFLGLLPLLGRVAGFTCLELCGGVLKNFLASLTRWRIEVNMRKRLFRSLIRQDISFFDSQCVGTLASRLINDTEDLQAIVNSGGTKLLTAALNCLGGVFMMLTTDLTMSLVGLAGVPLFLAATGNASKLSGYYGLLINDSLADGNTVATEALANIEAVQSNCAETVEVAKYEAAQNAYLKLVSRTLFSETVLNQTKQLFLHAADLSLLVLGMYRATRGQVTLGRCLAFRSYLRKLYSGLDRLLEVYGDCHFSLRASERYFDLVDRCPAVRDGAEAETRGSRAEASQVGEESRQQVPASERGSAGESEDGGGAQGDCLEEGTGENEGSAPPQDAGQRISADAETGNGTPPEEVFVEFRNVSLSFPESAFEADEDARPGPEGDSAAARRKPGQVLSGVSFRVRRGQLVAIAGRSGAGKSTLVKLLHRFYDPQEGSVYLDGVDIRTLPLHALRSRIGFVEQEPLLLRQTIAENIAYGLYSPAERAASDSRDFSPFSPSPRGDSWSPTASALLRPFSLSEPKSATADAQRRQRARESGESAEEDENMREILSAHEAASWPKELLKKTVLAAKVAHADEFIRRLPQGYFTLCGEGAPARLSGGQKQRIAIARALCRDPDVFVFDEATSCLDSATEAAVEATLELLRKQKKTIFVIAHKLSTTRKADYLLVLDKGQVVEHGHPEEILRRPSSRYAELFGDRKCEETC